MSIIGGIFYEPAAYPRLGKAHFAEISIFCWSQVFLGVGRFTWGVTLLGIDPNSKLPLRFQCLSLPWYEDHGSMLSLNKRFWHTPTALAWLGIEFSRYVLEDVSSKIMSYKERKKITTIYFRALSTMKTTGAQLDFCEKNILKDSWSIMRSVGVCQYSVTFFLSLLYKWFPVFPKSILQVLGGLQSRSKSTQLIEMLDLMLIKYVVARFIYTIFNEEVILWKACEITRNEI